MTDATMRDNVCVVTGASAGMGRIVAEELARREATVVLLARNRQRLDAARDAIARTTGNPRVEVAVADLASQRQVREAAAEIVARHPRLHVLVCNAGAFIPQRDETEDGVERTFATNFLGHFLLTGLLLDALEAGAPSRIVNVAARTGRYTLDLDDLAFRRRKYSTFSAASQSKLAQVMATVEQARRLDGGGVTVNAVYPGLVKTGLLEQLPPVVRALLNVVSTTPEKGAQATIRAAVDPVGEPVSGQFFGPRAKRLSLPRQARDEAATRRLWDLSVQFTTPRTAPA